MKIRKSTIVSFVSACVEWSGRLVLDCWLQTELEGTFALIDAELSFPVARTSKDGRRRADMASYLSVVVGGLAPVDVTGELDREPLVLLILVDELEGFF